MRDYGFNVLEASSADEAKDLLLAGFYVDVLFSDIRLPTDDGITLAKWARDFFPSISVVLTSGVEQSAKEAAELVSGIIEGPIVPKPYGFASLTAKINAVLVKRGQAPSAPKT
jgi:two-component system, response regulator PdtaR